MPAKSSTAVVMDRTGTSVYGFRSAHHISSENMAHSLKPQANAEDRNLRLQQNAPANTKVAFVRGVARPGRKNDVIGTKLEESVPR